MCTILMAYRQHPQWEWIILSNRDEFYERPSQAMHRWLDSSEQGEVAVLSGKDLRAKGTWLAISELGRFAAVTNYRDFTLPHNGTISRGHLPIRYLRDSTRSTPEFLDHLRFHAMDFDPFNFLVGDFSGLYYFSRQFMTWEKLAPGVHGLSNAHLNTPWFKVESGKALLSRLIADHQSQELENIVQGAYKILSDQREAPLDELPNTGLDLERERLLSRMEITSAQYGTRFKTIVLKDYQGRFKVWEWALTDDRQWELQTFDYI